MQTIKSLNNKTLSFTRDSSFLSKFLITLFLTAFLFLGTIPYLHAAALSLWEVRLENELAIENSEGKYLVSKTDPIRISGFGESNRTLEIKIGDRTLSPKISETGTWFVLFSMTEEEPGEYLVKANYKHEKNPLDVVLTTLVLEDDTLDQGVSLEPQNLEEDNNASTSNNWFLNIGALLLTLISGVILGLYLPKIKNKNDNKNR